MRSLTIAALVGLQLLAPATHQTSKTYDRVAVRTTQLKHHAVRNRTVAWRWQHKAGIDRSPTRYVERRATSIRYLKRLVRLWWKRAYKAMRVYHRQHRVVYVPGAGGHSPSGYPPHYNAWLCIHSHEGSWTDTGAPYWGGLQMDWDFMRSYGAGLLRAKGPASNWTPLEQMWVAEKAYSSGRGFGPWPQTARMCGLI